MVNSLSTQIEAIVKDIANNNPSPEQGTITKVYSDGFVDIKTNNDTLKHVQVIGASTTIGDNAILVYLNEEATEYLAIADVSTSMEMNTILALGLGLFKIKEDGHLYVELPMGLDNFFELDENNHLIVTLPSDVENKYHLEEDGHLYYTRG